MKKKWTEGRVEVISMGCSKNLVDSERLMRQLEHKGYTLVADPETPCGEYVMVNTCGFIGDAKEESINTILELSELKRDGKIGKLAVMGCLSGRYLDELRSEIPEIDFLYGKFDWKNFIEALPDKKGINTGEDNLPQPKDWERKLTTPEWSAYVKISEGCNRFCSFCAIPLITGRHKSRPVEEILEETRNLVAKGVKEFNVIAQDLSSYGRDLYHESRLAELIDRMADIEGVEWIRLHYAYPSEFPLDILDVMARRKNVCRYLDIALQHISDTVLGNMRRHITGKETRELLSEIRKRVPGIRIRTTLMVGFPGEGETEFNELLDFVREQRFDRMGAFAYCEEEGTWGAEHLEDSIPEEIKQKRLDMVMDLQQEIAEDINAGLTGKKVRVLVDRVEPDGTRVGRTEWDSPDVDQEVYIRNSDAKPGEFIEVTIYKSEFFDLYAE